MTRILLGAANFEVGKRDHEDTGGLYKLEKVRKQVLLENLQKEHSPTLLDFSFRRPMLDLSPTEL